MIAFEVRDGIIKPVVVCDFCHARIVGSGNALWLMPSPLGKPPRGPNFSFESPIFHTHQHCNRAFEVAYSERHGQTHFFSRELWEFAAQTLNNVAVRSEQQARRIFDSVKRVVESERKP
jgi:hypothetical protein